MLLGLQGLRYCTRKLVAARRRLWPQSQAALPCLGETRHFKVSRHFMFRHLGVLGFRFRILGPSLGFKFIRIDSHK